jgi:hypothetical protein
VVEAVAEVKAGLGHDVQPTWVQLMVSGDYEDASLAPAFALECFTTTTTPASTASAAASDSREPPPALFGGVVTGCVGGRGQCMDGPCVSVTAAKMPGVRAIPFRVDDASLPPQVDWAAAMRAAGDAAAAGDARAPSDARTERKTDEETGDETKPNGLALLVFADADFVEVDDLARRVHALLPDAIVVGGVAAPGGALFLGGGGFESGGGGKGGESSSGGAAFGAFSDAVGAAAVGVALQGPMRVEAHALHACRPVGPTMTLTRAGVEGVVLELDGEPAGAALTRALADVPEGSAGFPVALGIGEVLPVFADNNTQTSTHSSETKKFGDGNDDASGSSHSSGDVNRSADRSADRSANAHSRSGRARGGSASSLRGRVVRPETDPSDDRDRDRDRARRAATEAAETATAAAAYASGAGSGYVFRDIVGADRATGGVFVGRHPLEEGAPVRVHVRDAAWGKRASRALMRTILGEGARGAEEGGGGEGSGGGGGGGAPGRVAGAVMFTCASGDRMHAANFRDAAGGGVPVGGAYVAGEIAPARRGGQSFVLSHTSALGVFRDP